MKFSVTQFGAIPRPRFDSYRQIQAAVDTWKRYGGCLHFPHGIYETSQSIDLGGDLHEVGGTITCDGPTDETTDVAFDRNYPQPESSITQNGTAIVWTGKDKGGPLFRYSGTHLTWDGPTLRGDYAGELASGNRPTAGIEVHYTSGIGAGKIDFRQLSGSKLPIVLHANGKLNVDQFDVKRFSMHDVEVGFRSEDVQNVGSLFGFVTAQHVSKSVFSFANLTHTVVTHAMVNHSVKCFVHAEESDYMAGQFTCNSMKVDPESPSTLLVDAADKPQTFGTYSFRDVCGYSPSGTTVKASGAVIVTFDNCRWLYSKDCFDLQGSDSAECQVLISRSHIPNSLRATDLVKGNGSHCRVALRDCFGDKCVPRPDEYAIGGRLVELSDLQLVKE